MTANQLAEQYGLPLETVYKRLARGLPLDQPKREYTKHGQTKKRVRFSPALWSPDPLNALCNAWRTHQPLAALGVRHNLRWRV